MAEADAGILFGNWGGTGAGDLNKDGIVDGADIGLIYSNWTGDSASTTPVAAKSLPSKSIARPLRAKLVDAVMTDEAKSEELLSALAVTDLGTPLTRDRNTTKARTVRRNVR